MSPQEYDGQTKSGPPPPWRVTTGLDAPPDERCHTMSDVTLGLTTHSSAPQGSAVGMERELTGLEREVDRLAAQIKTLQVERRRVLRECSTLRGAISDAANRERAVVKAGGIPDSDMLRHYHDHGCAPAIFPKGDGTDYCSKDYRTPLSKVDGGWMPITSEVPA